MRRLLFTLSMLFGLTAQAAVEVFDYPNYRVYAIQDAATRFPASLFDSIDPEEKFVQTEADYAGSINVFIVEFKSDGRRIMIDAGLGSPRGKLPTEMKKAGLAPKSISDIFITHIHIDHVGGLPDFPHAKVHIAKDEYEAWAKDPSRKSLAKYLPDKKDLVLFDYDDGGFRGWGTLIPVPCGTRTRYLMMTFDRHNGSDYNWSYGNIYVFEADRMNRASE